MELLQDHGKYVNLSTRVNDWVTHTRLRVRRFRGCSPIITMRGLSDVLWCVGATVAAYIREEAIELSIGISFQLGHVGRRSMYSSKKKGSFARWRGGMIGENWTKDV